MQFENNGSAVAMATIAVALLMALVPMMNGTDADGETTYDRDYGTFYSYTLQLVFDGQDAESIAWDFGDGSPVSNEWNPRHTYAAKGEYIVTQTTTNSYNGGSTTVEKYRVVIAGFPVLTFESNGGSSVIQIEQTAYNVSATKPVDPVREGYTFDGWFTDSALTTPMDWSAGVTRSMTLYAGWTQDSTVDPPIVDPPVVDPPVTKYTITFDVNGGSVAIPSEKVQTETILLPVYPGVKDGYTFGGWSIDGVTHQVGQSIPVTGDMILTAVWTPVQDTPDTPGDDEPKDDSENGNDWIYLVIAILALIAIACVLYRYYGRRF